MFFKPRYRRSISGMAISGDDISPRKTIVGDWMFPAWFFPTRSTGQRLITRSITSTIAGHCPADILYSDNKERAGRRTSLQTHSVHTFNNELYTVVNWCLMCMREVRMLINDGLMWKPLSATNQSIFLKKLIHLPMTVIAESLFALSLWNNVQVWFLVCSPSRVRDTPLIMTICDVSL